jgi:SAM-dependent methyltransferase
MIFDSLSARSRGLAASSNAACAAQPPKCQICSSSLTPGLDLGHQPVSDLILSEAQLNEPEMFYPLQLFHCLDCGLCQLGFIVDPTVVYKDFPFVSGTTKAHTRHLQGLARQLAELLHLDGKSFAVDVGSNDGTLLKGYVPFGVKFLGVDPAAFPVEIANREGISTWHAFFNEETSERILEEHGHADAISAVGCLAHIADLEGFMRGVKLLLKPCGVFVTENQYWLDMVRHVHYDNVFHEHLRNYSLKPLIRLFGNYDMDIFDVERSDVYGGSLQVFSCHRGAHAISQRLRDLMALEEHERLYDPSTYTRFAASAASRKHKLFDAVYSRVSSGQKVIGIGAPAKASTVCNYCGLGPELVEYLTEINPLRTGKFLPGVHIPIVEEQFMFEDPRPAQAAILFAWNYYDEIIPKLRARGFAGEVLCP